MSQTKIEELRKTISDIDQKILNLIIERLTIAENIGQTKQEAGQDQVFDPIREQTLLQLLQRKAAEHLNPEEVNRIFLQIISLCRSRQSHKKICVFGEKNGWVEDAALSRFGSSAKISAVDNSEDFLMQTDAGNIGFACVTPQFASDRNSMLESLLSEKISIVEKFAWSPEFAVVSNRARDLSEVQELCVTNEMLRLLRSYFISISYDIKIKICRSASEAYENLQSTNPIAAVLPSNLVRTRSDLIMIRDGLKSDLLGPVNFMAFAKKPDLKYDNTQLVSVLCGVNGDNSKFGELLQVIKSFNLNVFEIQTTDFEGKPWKKIVSIEMSLPESREKFEQLLADLEQKCVLVKICGFYPVFSG